MINKQIQITKVIAIVVFFAWLILNSILLLRHELWRDEANVWLMARDLNPLQLFAEIKYQGHPCLWYLIVMPFAKMGLPFQSISALSFLIMTVSAGVFLLKTPAHIITKAVCLFSPFFTYYYSVVARNYCLIALFLVLLAWFYPKRNEKPVIYGILLGLLVQTDTIALAPAGLISLMWLGEGLTSRTNRKSRTLLKKILKGLWIPLVSLFLWIAQFAQVSDSPHFQMRDLGVRELLDEIKNYAYIILMRMTRQDRMVCTIAFLLFLVLGIVISVRLKNFWAMVVMTGSFLFQSLFSVMVYQLHIWHFISLGFVYIWMLWIWNMQAKEKKLTDKPMKWMLYIAELWIIALAVCMMIMWSSDDESSSLSNAWNGVYSDGVNVAAYIGDNISQDEILVSTDVPMAATVLAYLGDYTCYYAGNRQRASYADYSEEQAQHISLEELINWADKTFPDRNEVYLLNCKDSCLDAADSLSEYERLYESQESSARGEEYVLYRIPINQ